MIHVRAEKTLQEKGNGAREMTPTEKKGKRGAAKTGDRWGEK